jgi:hypothetical protein
LWSWLLLARPERIGIGLLYVLPLAWVALTFYFSLPNAAPGNFAPQTGEPTNMTQERLRGREGTREALTFYFGIVLIGLVVTLVFFISAFSLP